MPDFFDARTSSPFQSPLVATHTARRSTARAPPGHYQPDKSKRSKGAVDAPSKLPEAAAATSGAEQVGVEADVAAPERVFAVVALGGTQYKVSAGDIINAEYVPGAAVGSELVLDRVLVAGSVARTVLGRPVIPGAVVRCAVEEQVRSAAAGASPRPHTQAIVVLAPLQTLDRKRIVYKKKRRKRYQRFQGHRRLITRLRITAIDVDLALF